MRMPNARGVGSVAAGPSRLRRIFLGGQYRASPDTSGEIKGTAKVNTHHQRACVVLERDWLDHHGQYRIFICLASLKLDAGMLCQVDFR